MIPQDIFAEKKKPKSCLEQKIFITNRFSLNIEKESGWGKVCQRLRHFPGASLQCPREVGW